MGLSVSKIWARRRTRFYRVSRRSGDGGRGKEENEKNAGNMQEAAIGFRDKSICRGAKFSDSSASSSFTRAFTLPNNVSTGENSRRSIAAKWNCDNRTWTLCVPRSVTFLLKQAPRFSGISLTKVNVHTKTKFAKFVVNRNRQFLSFIRN